MLHLVDTTLTDLEDAGCVELGDEGGVGGGQSQSRGEEVRRSVDCALVIGFMLARFSV